MNNNEQRVYNFMKQMTEAGFTADCIREQCFSYAIQLQLEDAREEATMKGQSTDFYETSCGWMSNAVDWVGVASKGLGIHPLQLRARSEKHG